MARYSRPDHYELANRPIRTERWPWPGVLGTVSPDDLGGVCVYRCQIKKLCDAGLLIRVSYGRYEIGPAAESNALGFVKDGRASLR